MLKTMRLISVAAAAALALPALAGSWPPIAPRKASSPPAASVLPVPAAAQRSIDGFEFVGGEAGWQLAQPRYDNVSGTLVRVDDGARTSVAATKTTGTGANGFDFVGGEGGWQLSQHKYDFTAGKFVMSNECDHTIRLVTAPAPAEVEATRALYGGA